MLCFNVLPILPILTKLDTNVPVFWGRDFTPQNTGILSSNCGTKYNNNILTHPLDYGEERLAL